jgi:hypothetical protein
MLLSVAKKFREPGLKFRRDGGHRVLQPDRLSRISMGEHLHQRAAATWSLQHAQGHRSVRGLHASASKNSGWRHRKYRSGKEMSSALLESLHAHGREEQRDVVAGGCSGRGRMCRRRTG